MSEEAKVLEIPLWGTADQIRACFGIGRTVLDRLARQGFVRKAKMGEGKKTQVVFSGPEVNEYIESRVVAGGSE